MNCSLIGPGLPGRARTSLRRLVGLLATMAAALLGSVVLAPAPSATAGPIYQAVDADNDPYSGIYLRNGTSMANVTRDAAHYITYGTSLDLQCGTWGEAVGPYANRRWHWVRVVNGANAGRYGWIADRYVNTPNAANQLTPGEPECGATSTPAPAPTTGSATTPIWVGAPMTGYWAGYPNATSSRPEYHTPVYTVPGYSYKGDWAMDYYQVAGTRVRLYAAPKDSALGSGITAKVIAVGPTCASKVIAEGGYNVTVALYDRGVRVGSVSYAHVNPDFNDDGVTNASDRDFRGSLNRWGGYIGKVGAYTRNSCWDVRTSTGHHVHMEFANVKNYSCFRAGVANHAALSSTNYIGYLGGSYASTRQAGCPSGA